MKVDTAALGLAWLRVSFGVGLLRHGVMKLLGGGMEGFAQAIGSMGFPMSALFAWAAALSECVGGFCLVIGCGTRIAAFFICCTMSVALFIRHGADPFSVKELAYLYWSASVALMLLGGGRYAVGQVLADRRSRSVR